MADSRDTHGHETDERISYAKILVELDSLVRAEDLVKNVLDDRPDDFTALNLLAKIKHIKGEVSQAIGCWAQIHARSPNNENTQLFLMSLLNLAQNPERNAGDYIVLGQFQLVRKPAAHLELERAFGHFLRREPKKAREVCERLATEHKSKDREVYKIAVLAEAWIAQHSDGLDDARRLLEDLGKTSGFETDFDRVMALSRIYEQIGTAEALGSALNILRYLKRRQEKITLYPSLVQICRKLQLKDEATRYEETYSRIFKRRMHWPSTEEVINIASRRYVPLNELASIRRADEEVPSDLGALEQAIVKFLFDAGHSAKPFLEVDDGSILALKYKAAAQLALGEEQAAQALYLEILALSDGDMDAIGALLDLQTELSQQAKQILSGMADPQQILQGFNEAASAEPLNPVVWRRLGALQALLGHAGEAARCRERAEALVQAGRRRELPIGRVLTAAIYSFIGKKKGLIHEIWVNRHRVAPGSGGVLPESEILGNIHPDLRQSIRNIFLAMKEYAQAKFPLHTRDINDFEYGLKITKEDETSGGLSAGLPTALAFLSVFLQRPVPSSLASSGVVITDAHDQIYLRQVQDSEIKIKGAFNRNLDTLILPMDNARELANPFHVPREIVAQMAKFAGSMDQAVSLVFGREIWTA